MTLSRRQFNRIMTWGGATFAASTTSGIFFPKPAEAFVVEYLLKSLSVDKVFANILRYCGAEPIPGVLSPILQGENNLSEQIPSNAANRIRTADREFVKRDFNVNRTELAQTLKVAGQINSGLWGRQRQDNLGPNVGFGFLQKHQEQYSDSKISGPNMLGISKSIEILADQRLSALEISKYLLPSKSRMDDWTTWEGDGLTGSNVSFFQYENYSEGTVTGRYEVVEPGFGGFGRVQLTLEGENQPRRTVSVDVRFNQ